MNCAAILFDMDGTLLDSLADIAASMNHVLKGDGYAEHPLEAYRRFVGDGMEVLVERALPADARSPEILARCLAAMRSRYGNHWNEHTRLYDGIPELLDRITQRGILRAIISNKPHSFTVAMAEKLLPAWEFGHVLGLRDGLPPKPDPAGALETARLLGVDPAQCVLLGDSDIDVLTARAAGMHAVGAAWGIRGRAELETVGAELVIDHPLELLAALD